MMESQYSIQDSKTLDAVFQKYRTVPLKRQGRNEVENLGQDDCRDARILHS